MTTNDPPAVPSDVALLWGLRESSRRGPKAGLSLEAITDAAIAIADAEGLAAVSMARVAADLDAGTMSLYRHVGSKDELLLLMTDRAIDLPPAGLSSDDWRSGLSEWASLIRQTLRKHAWYAQVPMTRPPLGPRNLAWLDAALRCLADTPLASGERIQAVMTLIMFVHGEARVMTEMFADVDDPTQAENSYWATVGPLLTADRFPAVAELLAADAAQAADGGQQTDHAENTETDFRFGVDVVLDGIAALIERAGSRD